MTASEILKEFARADSKERKIPVFRESLTPREHEVLHLVSQGRSNQEIASELFIAENTVKNHLRNILVKLHLRNRIQAIAYALRNGFPESPPSER